MGRTTSSSTNATLIKLRGTPFKTAAELKKHEEIILKEEWQNIERARVRKDLFMRDANRSILKPLLQGFRAKFVGADSSGDHIIKVYFGDDESVHVEIDKSLQSQDLNGTVESLVKPLVDGLMGGYLTALGLKKEDAFQTASHKLR